MSSLVIPPSVFYTNILISCKDPEITAEWIDLILSYIKSLNELRVYLKANELKYGSVLTTVTHELYSLDVYITCLFDVMKGF